jgi:hypothetical protein
MEFIKDLNQTKNVAILMHASLTASMIILTNTALSGVPLLTRLLVLSAAWWLIVAAVAAANYGHLARQLLRTRVA